MTPSKQIIEVLDYLGEKIGITIDWTQANMMPYLQELFSRFIKWEISTSTVWIVIAIIMLIVAVILIKNMERISKIDDDGGLCFLALIIIIVCIVCGIPMICTQVFDIVECLTIPEKTLYDYVSELIK